MGALFQSAHMKLVQIIERNDAARVVVAELGERGIFQFRDMNSGTNFFKRSFSDDVRRCDDMQRRLVKMKHALDLARVRVPVRHEEGLRVPLAELDTSIVQYESELKELTTQVNALKRNHNSLREQRLVLEVCGSLYQGTVGAGTGVTAESSASGLRTPAAESARAGSPAESVSVLTSLVSNEFQTPSEDGLLHYIAGTMPSTRAAAFERVVYRATRGNCLVHNVPLSETDLLDASDAKGEAATLKNVVLVFFSGAVLRQKLSKICAFFAVTRYSLPELAGQRRQLLDEVVDALASSAVVLDRSLQIRRLTLSSIAHQWAEWQYTVRREKMTYNALNMCNFDHRRRVFVAEGWIACTQEGALREALSCAARKSGGETTPILNSISTGLTPPTYLPVSKITSAFQALVDTYGTPKYREVNPGVFAVVLFPALFGIMFGDVGHGGLLVIFALSMICNETRIGKMRLDDIGDMCFGGRYILLCNGLWAMYVGTLYNECFAVPFDLFGSRAVAHELDQSVGTYPWGIDPIWHHTSNKIGFFNSYKMKMSIIFGVAHMFLGICCSLVNHLEFKKPINIIFEFIPEVIFFLCIFGYLVFMIILKWATPWPGGHGPMLLNVLIDMFMSPGKEPDIPLYAGQATVQLGLLAAAFLSVPMLLFPIPIIGYYKHRAAQRSAGASNYTMMGADAAPHNPNPLSPASGQAGGGGGPHGAPGVEDEEEYSFTDEFVHQTIHTIEFVLGSISNTASYLRLWALSLAHSQLSELFWEKVMVGFALAPVPGQSTLVGSIKMVVFSFVWLQLSLAVLMCMENLSAFLHALRLQWVEFQNKFYAGTGHAFVPFSYATIDTLPDMDEPQ
eukprot:CAMPEP_0179873338 /NCGR_PEP_ID=MMETSP0982-20121206/22120_1 /TAXON_ID=483367 /ORGANISM="non described non described, Strain CCMP 2436" /LENGTH=849 /DNA_ID=CAMNT_0021764697 /DNA_START=114 /DNA_END=2663 /DNA_ORIENTATION=-